MVCDEECLGPAMLDWHGRLGALIKFQTEGLRGNVPVKLNIALLSARVTVGVRARCTCAKHYCHFLLTCKYTHARVPRLLTGMFRINVAYKGSSANLRPLVT
jgi:hypothetical protein